MSYRDPMASPPSVSPRQSAGTRLAEKLYRDMQQDPVHREQKVANSRASKNPFGAKAKPGAGGGAASAPRFLMCYLCGQQFGTASLKIHQPQCYVKKLLQWEKNPNVATRGPKPLSPEEHEAQLADKGIDSTEIQRDADKYNEVQYQQFAEKALVPCENCGRTFLPDRLEVHMRSCKPGGGSKPLAKRVPPPTKKVDELQPSSGSPDGDLDSTVHFRKGSPAAPRQRTASPGVSARRTQSPGITKRTASPAARYDKVPSRFKEQAAATLVPCKYCGRTFAKDRIEKHESVCVEAKKGTNSSASPPGKRATKVSMLKPKPSVPKPKQTRTELVQRNSPSPDNSGMENSQEFAKRVEAMMGAVSTANATAMAKRSGRQSPTPTRSSTPPVESPVEPSSPLYTSSTTTESTAATQRPQRDIMSPPPSSGPVTPTSPPPSPPPAAMAAPKFCTECGTKLHSATQKFCSECGMSVKKMITDML